MTIEAYPEMNSRIVDLLRLNEDNPISLYAAQRIEELEAEAERWRREFQDEQVRRDEWEKMHNQVAGTNLRQCKVCKAMIVDPPPAPDALPCGHPRSAVRGDGVTHWRSKCKGENWRVKATINRLISNIPAACGVLREQGCVNLAGQLGRDYENLVYWQEHGGLREASGD